MKVITLIGTRPELIKLSLTIAELDKWTQHILVHTGQNYDFELNQIFFQDLGIRSPDYFLEAAGDTVATTIARIIERFDAILEQEKPHALLLLGDTNSSLGAIVAKRRKIPVFHMEAGNRCFDERVPEEINRRIVDHVSDINLPYTEHARRYLIAEGIRPERIIKTGSPMTEILEYHRKRIDDSNVLARLSLERGEYLIVSAHREENVDEPYRLKALIEALSEVARYFAIRIVVSTHPRTQNRLNALSDVSNSEQIEFLKPLGFFDYIKLQCNAFCVVSDSGTLTEESSILGFPAVMIREAHERPEGMDEGNLVMAALSGKPLITAIEMVRAQLEEGPFRIPPDYAPDNVSRKVVRIIFSYTEYINRTVWFTRQSII